MAAFNLAQRIVAVVALAAGLRVLWVYLVFRSGGGWSAYAPLSDGSFGGVTVEDFSGSGAGLGFALLGIAFVAVWAVASLWLLGLSYPDTTSSPRKPGPQ